MSICLYKSDNKIPLLEYNLLINLLLKERNIEKSIANEITQFLKPCIYKYDIDEILNKNLLFEKCNIYNFFAKYNLKYTLFYKLFDKLIPTFLSNSILSKNNGISLINIEIVYKRYKNDEQVYYYDITYSVIFLYFLEISYFRFNLYSSDFEIYLNFENFKDFDKYFTSLFNNNKGLLMDDYIFSKPIKRYLYYYIFRKCIMPIIKYIFSKNTD